MLPPASTVRIGGATKRVYPAAGSGGSKPSTYCGSCILPAAHPTAASDASARNVLPIPDVSTAGWRLSSIRLTAPHDGAKVRATGGLNARARLDGDPDRRLWGAARGRTPPRRASGPALRP